MASGKSGQSFVFHGYLPKDKSERVHKIRQMESASKRDQTQIFMETPFRNNDLLTDLMNTLNGSTQLTIACNLATSKQRITSKPMEFFKTNPINLSKQPTVFYL